MHSTPPPRYNPQNNPILNSPYEEPSQHWSLDERGVAQLPVLPGRRRAHGVIPVPNPKSARQTNLYEQTSELALVNQLRDEVSDWRIRGYPGVTNATAKLLRYWRSDQPEPRLFFAQIEAVETLVYLHEAAKSSHPVWKQLDEVNRQYNDGMRRLSVKMATGTGKTAVIAMVIVWQAVNHAMNSKDRRFTNQFAVITPGLTVKERNARDLIPNHLGDDLYREWRLLPNDHNFTMAVNGARVDVTNFHALQLRTISWGNTSSKVKDIIRSDPFIESPVEMLKRALSNMDVNGHIMVLNDEGHHCHNTDPSMVETDSEGRKVADVWFNGIRHLKSIQRLHSVVDFSATPMFIAKTNEQKKGRDEIFPWTISDFPITDAIESGMVKIPRVPVADGSDDMEGPLFRNLYANSAGKTKQSKHELTNPLYDCLRGTLYAEYVKELQLWEEFGADTPPVFIIVANNISNASAIFDYIAGYHQNGSYVPGQLPELSNIDLNRNQPMTIPRTILIHSRLDAGDGKNITGKFWTYLKSQSERYRDAYPEHTRRMEGDTTDDVSIMRTVLNTVGRRGEMGEQVRCVVSVSMLTEGWDTRTVKHVLGFRRFGTQLLCEQVAGRSLRRVAYDNFDEETQRFPPEYADIVGIPFSFAFDRPTDDKSTTHPTHTYEVGPLPDRYQYGITWPNVVRYRLSPKEYDDIFINWESFGHYKIKPTGPETTEIEGIAGEKNEVHTERERSGTALFKVAAKLIEMLESDVINEVDGFAREHVLRRGRVFQRVMLSLREGFLRKHIEAESDAIWAAAQQPILNALAQRLLECSRLIVSGEKPVVIGVGGSSPLLQTGDIIRYWSSRPDKLETTKSHMNIAPCANRWELSVAQTLDSHPKVAAWVRNDRQRWQIPYMYKGEWASYEPDFVTRITRAKDDVRMNVVIEVKGREWPSDHEKRWYTREYWLPAVNENPIWSEHGLWEYLYIDDPALAYQQISNLADIWQTDAASSS